jgi:hypothetical protein
MEWTSKMNVIELYKSNTEVIKGSRIVRQKPGLTWKGVIELYTELN